MKIAICCSSSDKLDKQYIQSSQKLCEAIFRQKHDLVFGAMNHGIMGIAYRTAKSHGRNVTGIAPELYRDDFKELDCETELLTKNVSDRMQVLIDNSDVLLFLPGGVGTLYELMAALEMKRSKEFNKPLIIYNETGFFNEILQMLVLNPKLAILDETDSGLDVDAIRTVSKGIEMYKNSDNAVLIITHNTKILHSLKPDFVHVLVNGKIVKTGKADLAKEIEENGYGAYKNV